MLFLPLTGKVNRLVHHRRSWTLEGRKVTGPVEVLVQVLHEDRPRMTVASGGRRRWLVSLVVISIWIVPINNVESLHRELLINISNNLLNLIKSRFVSQNLTYSTARE
jgi:hypothetical protein